MVRRSLIVCLTLVAFASAAVWALSYRRPQSPQVAMHPAFRKDFAYFRWTMDQSWLDRTTLQPLGLAAQLGLTADHRAWLSAHEGTLLLAYAKPYNCNEPWRSAAYGTLGFRVARCRVLLPEWFWRHQPVGAPQPGDPEYEELVR